MTKFAIFQFGKRLLPVACCLLVGCGGIAGPVEGTVTLDGKPLDGATVSFHPETQSEKTTFGFTDQHGKFTLTRLGEADGVAPGSYRVTVSKTSGDSSPAVDGNPPEPGSPEMDKLMKDFSTRPTQQPQQPKYLVPVIYTNPNTTPLQITIPKGGDRNVELKLDSKASAGK